MENLKLNIVLKDTPIEYGLDRESIVELYDKLGDSSIEVYPIEIPAQYHECSAMGFITVDAADQIDYSGRLRSDDYVRKFRNKLWYS